ncbi:MULTISPECIES: ABC transporter substrate-binding protein [Bacillaceae]|uniref:Myristoyl transferase n=1 Tax=Alkalicoccobacillus plakortidis TaxID=444060 RepID=A0A9D5DU95_9BACI|nr:MULTISPECIES: ABC transporter substrate-binding protein [Bacillaceae]KQL56789.1 myristoyl transferase [Alkalicoccobacillus plakortidis]
MKRFIPYTVAGCFLGFLVGCGNEGGSSLAKPTVNADTGEIGEPEVEDVTLRLNWRFKGEFAPFYVAQEKGFFEEYGLNVDVLEGNGSTSVMQTVAQGQDDLGITSTVEPAQGVEEGMPITMIATYMNSSPIMIASHPDTPVETPADLEGKSIAMAIASTFTNIFPRFLDQENVDATQVEAVQVEASARNGLFLGKEVDAVAIFSTNELPVFEQELGYELTPLYLSEYQFDLAGLTVIGNNQFLNDNPNTAARFLAAMDEAFRYTLDHVDEAVAISAERFPDAVDEEVVRKQLLLLEEIAQFDSVPYGWIEEENIAETLTILEGSGLISDKQDAEAYFTNEFFQLDQ